MRNVFGKTVRWPAVSIVVAALATSPAQAKPGSGFIGRYAFAGSGGNPKQVFIDLDVSRSKGGRLSVGFGGGHADGSGAAPDGGGSGVVGGDGVLHFDYEDSFANKGTGTLRRTKTGEYRLTIDIKDVQDSRCLVFYGEHFLKRSGEGR